jgi:hypothetical protein
MLRLVLLLLYLFEPSSTSPQDRQGVAGPNEPFLAVTDGYGAGYDPDGALAPPTEYGAGFDPNGSFSPPAAASDAGAGYDPNG